MNENKLNILHINCNYMGTKLHKIMINHLDKYTKNTIFCPIYSGSNIVTIPNNEAIVSNCFKSLDRFFFFRKQKKILKSIIENVNVNEYQCIHAYTLFTDGNCAYELNKRYNIPYVVAIRATDIEFYKYRIYLRERGLEILRKSCKIFFLSEKTKEIFIKKYIPQKYSKEIIKKIEIIPNGIDDFWLNNSYKNRNINEINKKIQNKHINIIVVSQILKRKNIPLIQKATKTMVKSGWDIELNVVGKSMNKRELKKIIKDKNTKYLGEMNKEELIKYYRKADIFILPSKRETFGLVYAEAMTQGLPAIYSKNEGFDGQFVNGKIGYAINPNRYNDIVDKILEVTEQYEVLSKNCLAEANKFSWDKICKKYLKIYSSLNFERG